MRVGSAILLIWSMVFALKAYSQASESGMESRMESPDFETAGFSKIRLIPTVGLSLVGIESAYNTSEPQMGGSVGVLGEYGDGQFTGQTGLIYNQFGGQERIGEFLTSIRTEYISLPLLGKINFSGNPDRTLYAKFGVMPGWLLAQSGDAADEQGQRGFDFSPGVNSFDIPMVFGLGAAYPVTLENSLIFEGAYVRSLTNIGPKDGREMHNEGFVFRAGYSLQL